MTERTKCLRWLRDNNVPKFKQGSFWFYRLHQDELLRSTDILISTNARWTASGRRIGTLYVDTLDFGDFSTLDELKVLVVSYRLTKH